MWEAQSWRSKILLSGLRESTALVQAGFLSTTARFLLYLFRCSTLSHGEGVVNGFGTDGKKSCSKEEVLLLWLPVSILSLNLRFSFPGEI